MPITIFTQSKKDLAPIYIRVREKGTDAKTRTPFMVNPSHLVKGTFKEVRAPRGADAITKGAIKEKNKGINILKDNVDALVRRVNDRLNNRQDYEIVNSEWLKEIVNPKAEHNTTTLLVDFFDVYFADKKATLRHSTVKKIKSIQNRLKAYEKDHKRTYIAQVNKRFKNSLFDWLELKNYAHNTKIKMLKVILTICNHARYERGLLTHPEIDTLTKNMKYVKAPHVYLTPEDIAKIIEVDLEGDLDVARDWLLISCYTGQRISDFFRFVGGDVYKDGGDHYIDITQQKTELTICIYLNDHVLRILRKYDNNFPPKLSKSTSSNEVLYNRKIKEVCRLAKLNEIVTVNQKKEDENRYETKDVKKYLAVTSHIGRRSFATNNYSKFPTELIMAATGHKTEKQFLEYVGLPPLNKAKEFARLYKEQVKPSLTVVKDIANG